MRLIDNAPEIWILVKDGTAQRKITVGLLPAWSPDGKKLAFFRQLDNVRQIFVVDLVSGTERQLTRQGSNAAAVWSPEGNKIAYWSGEEKGFGQVWVMNSDGTQKKQLTQPEKNDYTPKGSSANAPAWLYGKRIAYWAGVEHAYGQIWGHGPGRPQQGAAHQSASSSIERQPRLVARRHQAAVRYQPARDRRNLGDRRRRLQRAGSHHRRPGHPRAGLVAAASEFEVRRRHSGAPPSPSLQPTCYGLRPPHAAELRPLGITVRVIGGSQSTVETHNSAKESPDDGRLREG
jgi:hypothetical protein